MPSAALTIGACIGSAFGIQNAVSRIVKYEDGLMASDLPPPKCFDFFGSIAVWGIVGGAGGMLVDVFAVDPLVRCASSQVGEEPCTGGDYLKIAVFASPLIILACKNLSARLHAAKHYWPSRF